MALMAEEDPIFTIGHSNHTIGKFKKLLQQHRVTAVADVRSVPYSRMHPQFNREALMRSLKKEGIAYVFIGEELGARSNDVTCYDNGRVQYRRLAQTKAFRTGLDRVRTGRKKHRIVLMCAEHDPLECHRALLISRDLVDDGIPIVHIHADGHLEPHADAIGRLLQQLGLPEHDLFRTPSEMVDEAYSRQEARVAYVDQRLGQEGLESKP